MASPLGGSLAGSPAAGGGDLDKKGLVQTVEGIFGDAADLSSS